MDIENQIQTITYALQHIENTQDSVVQTSQQLLNMAASDQIHIPTIVNIWQNAFDQHVINNEHAKKILAMLYVVNDVLQKCKMQKCEKFNEEFKKILPNKFTSFYEYHLTTPKYKIEVIKMLNIWKQKRLYSNEYLSQISPPQQIPQQPQNQKENQMIIEPSSPIMQNNKEIMLTELPSDLITIPKDLITLAQASKDLQKWSEKSKEFETKLYTTSKKTAETQYMLEEFKRSQELQLKYRTVMLKSLAELLQNDDVGHLKMVLELKKVAQRKKEIQELEEQINAMEENIIMT